MIFLIEFTVFSIITLVILFMIYVKWSQKYWASRNVPYIKPNSIFGNMDNFLSQKYGVSAYVKNGYDEFKRRGHKHGGIYLFTKAIYIPVDAELIKNITTKDFAHFLGHGAFVNEKRDPLRVNLVNLEGEKWKYMRAKLTPTFTSGKMKMMFQTLLDCSAPMIDYIGGLCKNGKTFDIKEILACYTTDIIGSCAFGLECNSFKNPNAEFRAYGRKIFEPTFMRALQRFIEFASSRLNRLVPMKMVPLEIETFFMGAVKNIMDYRRSSGVKRNDFIELFLEMEEKAKANEDRILTLQEVAAQAFVFFLAGFETSSTVMTFCLHELAFDQSIQEKLREEIREVFRKNNGVLTYDAVMEMKYMDKVINETLRKYPPVPAIPRMCSVDYKVPGTDVTLEKGTTVFISALGLHRDEEFYPNPDIFDPERFSEESRSKRPAFSFLPFGEGPRICIGLRFGMMQAKTGLAILLNNYRFFPAKDEQYNFDFDPRSVILTKKGTIMSKVEKLLI